MEIGSTALGNIISGGDKRKEIRADFQQLALSRSGLLSQHLCGDVVEQRRNEFPKSWEALPGDVESLSTGMNGAPFRRRKSKGFAFRDVEIGARRRRRGGGAERGEARLPCTPRNRRLTFSVGEMTWSQRFISLPFKSMASLKIKLKTKTGRRDASIDTSATKTSSEILANFTVLPIPRWISSFMHF